MAGSWNGWRVMRRASLVTLVTLGAACGGGGGDREGGDAGRDRGAGGPEAGLSDAEALMRMKSFPTELDAALADRGAELFQAKGCVACHTIGAGRLVGPDLSGVTERRTPGWMAAQILEPDSMIKNDPTTRELFAEYMTPMSDQGLTVDEARAVLEFLRRDAGGG